jgi:alpha-beta hydrolase superfamily lysophospholipase
MNTSPSSRRRDWLLASAVGVASATGLSQPAMAHTATESTSSAGLAQVVGREHWAIKQVSGQDIRLFMWNKRLANETTPPKATVLLVHGSSVSSTPVFDLTVPGRDDASLMDWLARRGYDVWCFDCEGYGRSDKSRPVTADVAMGADDLEVVSQAILKQTGGAQLMVYGSSSGALRAALFAQRQPQRVARLLLDAMVWTGEGSPTLAERRKRLPAYLAHHRRPIDRAMVRSIFTRDHPGTSDLSVVDAFADAVLALDDSMPTGTYIDMTSKLPVCDPTKIKVPTVILRGEYDGIASMSDLMGFFERLAHPDKQLVMMQGIAHSSTRSKNYRVVYHLIERSLSQPTPVYTGA